MKSKYHKLRELLPPELYVNEDWGWELFDTRLIETIDWLKELFGHDVSLIINNWSFGGSRKNCGFRTPDCSVGARLSRHRLGMAVDIISPQMSAQEMRTAIDLHQEELPHPVRIEEGVSWLHIDVDNFKKNEKIYWFDA